jgi:hypothetical protein
LGGVFFFELISDTKARFPQIFNDPSPAESGDDNAESERDYLNQGIARKDLSGWNWFAAAWQLAAHNVNQIDGVMKQSYSLCLTTLAYLADKADAERLEIERARLLRR